MTSARFLLGWIGLPADGIFQERYGSQTTTCEHLITLGCDIIEEQLFQKENNYV